MSVQANAEIWFEPHAEEPAGTFVDNGLTLEDWSRGAAPPEVETLQRGYGRPPLRELGDRASRGEDVVHRYAIHEETSGVQPEAAVEIITTR